VKVIFLKISQTEFDDAIAHYESEQSGLGARFAAPHAGVSRLEYAMD
jgi:hypothetical protein